MKYLESLEKFGINLGLERIRFLLERLDNPHLKFKAIHVAGTNGKGSTCAMIASILKEAGYKVGLYTSPHLFKYNERIKINGKDISDQEFARGITRIKRSSREKQGLRAKPTVFEVLTALAFWYFAQNKVDYAVVEVGLGGRLDATNVITPLVSVITNIDYEHTAILGKTLSKIAAEKAAIIKPGVPVVTAETKPEPLGMIRKVCVEQGSKLETSPLSADYRRHSFPSPSSMERGAESRKSGRGGVRIGLLGPHQTINAACAIAAIRLAGIKVSRKKIIDGLKKVKWPGRFQIVSRKPLTIVDGAHNPSGIQVLKQTLRSQFPAKKFTFIVGVQKDKDSRKMLEEIRPLAQKIIFTRSTHKQAAKKVAGKRTIPLSRALKISKDKDRIITGSFFLVADALNILDVRTRGL